MSWEQAEFEAWKKQKRKALKKQRKKGVALWEEVSSDDEGEEEAEDEAAVLEEVEAEEEEEEEEAAEDDDDGAEAEAAWQLDVSSSESRPLIIGPTAADLSPDPLLLDGCRVRLLWPQTKAGVVKLRQRTCLVRFRVKAGGGGIPGGRAYVVLVERRSGAPPRERPVSWRTLASRSLAVLSSPRAPPTGPWTTGPWSARERAAARARLDAGEEVASVALSLGRTEVSTREEMELGGGGGGVRSSSYYARGLSRSEKESKRDIIIQQASKGPVGRHGQPAWASIARELQRLHPTLFGDGAPGMPKGGIRRQTVWSIVTANSLEARGLPRGHARAAKGDVADSRGCSPAPKAGTARRSPRLRRGRGAADSSSDDEEEGEEEDEDEEAVAALVAAHAAVEWSERLVPVAAGSVGPEDDDEEEDDEEDDDDDDEEEEYEDTDEGAAAFFAAQAAFYAAQAGVGPEPEEDEGDEGDEGEEEEYEDSDEGAAAFFAAQAELAA